MTKKKNWTKICNQMQTYSGNQKILSTLKLTITKILNFLHEETSFFQNFFFISYLQLLLFLLRFLIFLITFKFFCIFAKFWIFLEIFFFLIFFLLSYF